MDEQDTFHRCSHTRLIVNASLTSIGPAEVLDDELSSESRGAQDDSIVLSILARRYVRCIHLGSSVDTKVWFGLKWLDDSFAQLGDYRKWKQHCEPYGNSNKAHSKKCWSGNRRDHLALSVRESVDIIYRLSSSFAHFKDVILLSSVVIRSSKEQRCTSGGSWLKGACNSWQQSNEYQAAHAHG